MADTVLLTAAEEDSEHILRMIEEFDAEVEVLHFPLEIYVRVDEQESINETFDELDDFDNIVYGSLRNASFFMEQVEERGRKKEVRRRLNLTLDEETAEFLEEHEVPAVCSFAGGRSINLVEFMLRLHRMGPTLYPCGSHKKEEIPGFLEELDIPVRELELFNLEGPPEERLHAYRNRLSQQAPDRILFHSRRAVNRTLAAFPGLPYDKIEIISADEAISRKLEEQGISVDRQGEGSWKSLADLL